MATKVANQSNTSNTETQSPTALDEPTRAFVRLALGAGLIELDELKKVVVSLLAESEIISRDRLAIGLVGAGLLTDWQVKKLFDGRGRGFFLGSYKLLRPLGKGGMGVVYLGEHRVMKRPMALKVLHADSASDAKRIARFQDEARAAAQLDHLNIVRAYDFAEDNGKLFIAMEYVEGIDLQYAVQRDGLMPIEAAIDATLQAAQGLAHAHGRGIVHRDIKPANLLLRSDGVLKISDMGLARMGWQGEAPNDAGQSRLLGTSEFLAPEQALDSRSVDGRADIYSLGCTLYYLLTGRPPYPGATLSQRIAKHQTSAPPDIRLHRSDCPPALANLAIRMMAKRPEDRIPSATELISQLTRISMTGATGQGRVGQSLRQIAPTSDTIAERALHPSTLSESSIGGEVEPEVLVNDNMLLDFASLPPVLPQGQVSGASVSRAAPTKKFPSAVPGPSTPRGPLASRSSSVASAPAGPRVVLASKPAQRTNPGTVQNILLGIGLAFACFALIAVLGIGAYVAMRPENESRPVIKSVEGEGGNQIIVLGDDR